MRRFKPPPVAFRVKIPLIAVIKDRITDAVISEGSMVEWQPGDFAAGVGTIFSLERPAVLEVAQKSSEMCDPLFLESATINDGKFVGVQKVMSQNLQLQGSVKCPGVRLVSSDPIERPLGNH